MIPQKPNLCRARAPAWRAFWAPFPLQAMEVESGHSDPSRSAVGNQVMPLGQAVTLLRFIAGPDNPTIPRPNSESGFHYVCFPPRVSAPQMEFWALYLSGGRRCGFLSLRDLLRFNGGRLAPNSANGLLLMN